VNLADFKLQDATMLQLREKKERKGTKSHKLVIFHIIVEKPPVNRF